MNASAKFLIFQAGPVLAFSLAAVREILPFVLLSKPPTTASMVTGVVNIGGQAVTVLDLGELLGVETAEPSIWSHIIWLKGTPVPLAVLVERTISVVDGNSISISELPDGMTFNGMVKAELLNDGTPIAQLLDVEALLTEEEARRLRSFADRAQTRLNGLEVA